MRAEGGTLRVEPATIPGTTSHGQNIAANLDDDPTFAPLAEAVSVATVEVSGASRIALRSPST